MRFCAACVPLAAGRQGQLDLRAGELVEVRSLEEILATLDSRGEVDSLPFMPEMEAWCGRQVRVFRRVDKIFDWILMSGLRRMRDTVILEGLRCDGCYHGGCQADCPILWKEAWLRRASMKQKPAITRVTGSRGGLDLGQFTRRIDAETSESRFVCQLSKMPEATTPTAGTTRATSSGSCSAEMFVSVLSLPPSQSLHSTRCSVVLGASASRIAPPHRCK